MTDPDSLLRQLLSEQEGVITRRQARACGISDSAVDRRVASGAWRLAARGVLVSNERALTPTMRARIAVAAVGGRSALASTSAAWWHRLVEQPPYPFTVITPHGRHRSQVRGVRIWHRTVADVDLTVVRGLPVTSVGLTVLDAAVAGGIAVMDSALLRAKVTMPDLIEVQARNAGRRGSARSREMLGAMSTGARSEGERLLVRHLRRSAIPGWQANFPVLDYLADIAFPTSRLILEVDGFAFHTDAAAFQRDRERQNALVGAGWTVLRFTWFDLTEHPDAVVAHIRRNL